MGKVPKNFVEYEETEWLCSVRSLTDMLVGAAAILGWSPAQYIPWAFISVALVAFILTQMIRSRAWDHVSVHVIHLMEPLQLVIAASLFSLHWTRIYEINSPLSLAVSQNVTDSLSV